jgi:DNA uptake protein ComE-like DNA-binding protein
MDLNTASVAALTKLVGLERAYDLILWRPYLSWEEVAGVPGFDGQRIADLQAAGAHIRLPGDPRTLRDEEARRL